MALRFEVQEASAAADLKAVDDGLDAFNRAEPQLQRVRPLHVFARDDAGRVVGGAVGRSWGRCCELQQLWVADGERGRGTGSVLMDRFEAEAIARGCALVYLTTFSFQAPGFYARRGYEAVLQTRGYTGGIARFEMHKRLAAHGR